MKRDPAQEATICRLLKIRRELEIKVEDGLTLCIKSGDAERFERLWRTAWRRIPKNERALMFSYWSSLRHPVPFVLLCGPDEYYPPDGRDLSVLSGMCSTIPSGRESSVIFWYSASDTYRAPDNYIIRVILHEIGHSFCHAVNSHPGGREALKERQARSVSNAWFNHRSALECPALRSVGTVKTLKQMIG